MPMHFKNHNTTPPQREGFPSNIEPGLDSDDWGVDWMQSSTPKDEFSNEAKTGKSSFNLFSNFLSGNKQDNRTGHASPDLASWFRQRQF